MSYHPAKFVAHSHYGSGAIIILVFHVVAQNHLIKRLCDFIGGTPS